MGFNGPVPPPPGGGSGVIPPNSRAHSGTDAGDEVLPNSREQVLADYQKRKVCVTFDPRSTYPSSDSPDLWAPEYVYSHTRVHMYAHT